jgi:hypothetical protein
MPAASRRGETVCEIVNRSAILTKTDCFEVVDVFAEPNAAQDGNVLVPAIGFDLD